MRILLLIILILLGSPNATPDNYMKHKKESTDSIKMRRQYSPRNSTKPIRKRKSELNSTSLNKFYKSKEWRSTRDDYIEQHPFCEQCLMNGIVKPATDVHHIVPFSQGRTDEERWQLLLDFSNLRALCKKCHHRVHELGEIRLEQIER